MKRNGMMYLTIIAALYSLYSLWFIYDVVSTRSKWDGDCNKLLSRPDRAGEFDICIRDNLDYQRFRVTMWVITASLSGSLALLGVIILKRTRSPH